MPSIEAPTYYEHVWYHASRRADDFLKWIDNSWYMKETGSTESPLGWVGLIDIGRSVIAEYVSTFGDPWISEARNFQPGWYIVRIDENGLVWGMYYGPSDSTLAEEGVPRHGWARARADFAEAEKVYEAWLSLEEEEPTTRENEMELYIDTVTGTWGEAVDLRIVTAKSNLDEVLDTMSDDEVTKVGLGDGRPIDQYIANQGTANAEKMFLVCKNCGEAFDTLQTAHEHGTFISGPDPSWCGEDGFDLVPESDAF